MNEYEAIAQYVPHVLLTAALDQQWWQQPGTLVFSDVSGFTALSEKLARHGKVGAEEMVNAISTVFTPLLAEIARHDGDVLKFGGDALLTFFSGPGHERRAAACAHRMRHVLRTQGRVRTAYGTVSLGMSQGLHSGDFAFFVCGERYADLVVAGPAVSTTLAMESAAERGEVLLSPATARALDARLLREGHDGGELLANAPAGPVPGHSPAPVRAGPSAERFVPLALRGRLADIVSDSEHRQLTIGFLQFTGCDESLRNDGPAALHRKLNDVAKVVTEAAEEHDVTMICIDVGGDGGKFMLACGAPDAVEHDSELMLRFGLSVLSRELPLPLRLGVNRGNVFGGRVGGPTRWTYSTMGDPVNLAARVMGKAPSGAILATTSVLDQVRKVASIRPVEPFSVKGKAQPVTAGIVESMASTPLLDIGEFATPFMGRQAELSRIVDAWPGARAGSGAVIEIVGEAGSGKSRLVREAIRAARPDHVIRVGGERYHRGSAYFALHLLLRRLMGISPDADAREAGEALTTWLDNRAPQLVEWAPLLAVAARATVPSTYAVDAVVAEYRTAKLQSLVLELLPHTIREPAIVVLEDAFWYDDASVQVLKAILQSLDDLPWLVCVTRRNDASGLHAGLGFDADRIDLHSLPADSAVALARAAAQDTLTATEAQQLAEAANHNPFFVLQIAQSWQPGASAMPVSVEAVVASRLDRLPVPSRRLLRRAAVLGSYVDVDLLTTVTGEGVNAEALEPLLGEYLVEENGRYRFVHDLFRTVAYDSLPYRSRRDLHARVGDALEKRGDHAARAALLSVHFHAAADHEKTWRYSVLGGDGARETYATGEAAALYERALGAVRHLPSLPRTEVVRVQEAFADVQELLGHYDDAARTYLRAQRLSPDPPTNVRLLRKLGIVRERQSRYREALGWYTRGISRAAQLGAAEASAARAALLVGTASARYRQGRFALAASAARAAVGEAAVSAEPADIAHAYFLLDAALTDLHDPQALEFRERALPIYQEIGDLVGEADVHNNIGIDAYYEGRLDDALASYQESLHCRRRVGDVVGAATAENNIGEVLSDLGRFDEAAAMFEEALAVWRRASYPVGVALACSNLARVEIRRGRPDLAGPLLDEAEEQFRDMGASALLFETRARRAEMLLARNQPQAARELVAELLQSQAASSASEVVRADLLRVEADALDRIGPDSPIVLPEQRTISLDDDRVSVP